MYSRRNSCVVCFSMVPDIPMRRHWHSAESAFLTVLPDCHSASRGHVPVAFEYAHDTARCASDSARVRSSGPTDCCAATMTQPSPTVSDRLRLGILVLLCSGEREVAGGVAATSQEKVDASKLQLKIDSTSIRSGIQVMRDMGPLSAREATSWKTISDSLTLRSFL